MPVRCVKVKADQPDPSHVRLAVEAISAGQLVVLPTETVYGFAAVPGDPASIELLRRIKNRPDELALTHHLAAAEHASGLAHPLPATARRLVERYWPGPLTIVVEGLEEATIGLRVPANAFTQQVAGAFDRGLFLSSTNLSGEPPLLSPDEIGARFDGIDLLFDGGPPPLAQSSAVVRCVGTDVEVLREGTLGRAELRRVAAATLLFVCTGNTCRSPLAAALARQRAATALEMDEDALPARGLRIASAGMMASAGAPASANSIAAAAEVGLDLIAHRASSASAELLEGAGLVYALANSHLDALLHHHPDLAGRAELLDPDGLDILDPFGADLDVYRATRDAIAAALDRRWSQIDTWLGAAR